MYYETIFRELSSRGIRYAVAGGVALVLHGVVRFTADLDLIVDLERDNLGRFIQAMKDLGYQPRNPVKAEELLEKKNREQWKRDKGMEVFSFVHPGQPMSLVGVFIDEKIPFQEVEGELLCVSAKDVAIPVVSLRHLKKLKSAAGRPQDLADIEALETLERGEEER